jgi:hypothetical protein
MVIQVPLAIDSSSSVQDLKDAVRHHLADDSYGRSPIEYDAPPQISDPLEAEKALSRPGHKCSGRNLGVVISFRGNRPFATVHFWEDPASYSLGGHAGWSDAGDSDTLMDYYDALDTLLDDLGVLHDTYELSCPCGESHRTTGGYRQVQEWFANHNDAAHGERVSNSVLVKQEVVPAAKVEPPAP